MAAGTGAGEERMTEPIRTLSLRDAPESSLLELTEREWLVTNGLGGYASGTLAGIPTRRFHGLLIASLPSPHGRWQMFNHLVETVDAFPLSDVEQTHRLREGMRFNALAEFRLEWGLPVWVYEKDGLVLEKRLFLSFEQNTTFVRYVLLAGGEVALDLRPALNFRPHEGRLDVPAEHPYPFSARDGHVEIEAGEGAPALRVKTCGEGAGLVEDFKEYEDVFYSTESRRGYDAHGGLWSPGYFRLLLRRGQSAALVASTEPWEAIDALPPDEALAAERERRQELLKMAGKAAKSSLGAELVLAADQFIITPAVRTGDSARARASGEEARSVIAGYHWFTDWGRDTMISLEGLALCTGRYTEARRILRTFAGHIRNGLIPNMFPEGDSEGLYHTADATLWFFHAIERYLQSTGDEELLRLLMPKLEGIIESHLRGTDFGIHADPADGLLIQGAEGYQLTWMDAKVEGWVVTPRRGKAVEINALWYNALRIMSEWRDRLGNSAAARNASGIADKVYESFQRRFWYETEGYLYDVVDGESGDDPALRPNQVLAISLDYPVLDRSRWEPVMQTVEKRLLTPVGLRSLAPGHPDYKQRYDGDLRSRDAAYHQGTVWAWLIGPFLDAWRKTYPTQVAHGERFLEGLRRELDCGGIGSVSEIFDAEKPYTSRGCIAQAWSVAEFLRCHLATCARRDGDPGSSPH
jgi:predicted glycogen debranching enzyme